MSERITEAELARLEVAIRRDWSPGLPVPPESGWPLRLVAELRRLRGLIEAWYGSEAHSIEEDCTLDALFAEAEAIRAEQANQPRS